MSDDKKYVDFQTLEKMMIEIFLGLGVPQDEAEICANVLITSDSRLLVKHFSNSVLFFSSQFL